MNVTTTDPTPTTLTWEDAGNDDGPGDQNAATRIGEHGYWSLGSNGDGWSVELVERDDALEETGSVPLGQFPTEPAAKQAAADYERTHAPALPEPADLTDADLLTLAGTSGAREYKAAEAYEQPDLAAWLRRLPTLSDDAFTNVAEIAISQSALVASFRGNWSGDHCKASAAFHDAHRRHVAAGHAPDCRGANLYDRAWKRIARDNGISVEAPWRCTCAKASA